MRRIHLGEIFQEDFLDSLGMSVGELAKELGVSLQYVNDFVYDQGEVTPDVATKLPRYFGTTQHIGLNFQADHNLRRVQIEKNN